MPYIGNITQDFNVSNAMLDTDSVTSIKIVDGTIEGADIAANLDLSDSQKIRFGAGNDLQIYHDGSHSYIDDAGTGNLYIRSSQLVLQNAAGDEDLAILTSNGAVKLYFNDSKKFETTNTGISVAGSVAADGLAVGDSELATFGSSADLQIFHGGTDSHITNNTGQLKIAGDAVRITNNAVSETQALFTANGAVELYHDNSKKFETTSAGVEITGTGTNSVEINGTGGHELYSYHDGAGVGWATGASSSYGELLYLDESNSQIQLYTGGSLRFNVNSTGVQIPNDSGKLQLGNASQDLQIYHDGSNSHIAETGTGVLKISGSAGVYINKHDNSETMAAFLHDAGVELYFNNSKKFETQSAGVEITGKLTFATEGLANGSIDLGIDADLNLYHDNSDAFIDNNTGDFYIRNDGNSTSEKIRIQAKGGEQSIIASPNGAVELYHDNVKKFETNSDGVLITRTSSNVRQIQL